ALSGCEMPVVDGQNTDAPGAPGGSAEPSGSGGPGGYGTPGVDEPGAEGPARAAPTPRGRPRSRLPMRRPSTVSRPPTLRPRTTRSTHPLRVTDRRSAHASQFAHPRLLVRCPPRTSAVSVENDRRTSTG